MTVNPVAATPLAALRAAPVREQAAAGYVHTLQEILQQPVTWVATAAAMRQHAQSLRAALDPAPVSIVLTGSGSSHHIGECLALELQRALGIAVRAVDAGTLLTHAPGVLTAGPALLVSIARSGDSPESAAVVDALLRDAPQCRHLFFTCNAAGRLATAYRDEPRVTCLVLDDVTNDRSLVMTSSFTNLFLSARALASCAEPDAYAGRAEIAASLALQLLHADVVGLAALARGTFDSAVYLGSGAAFGAARECALKMLEMSGGGVRTSAESWLGLRHGPMSAVHSNTLVVGFLSSDATVRDYEIDLLRELRRKGLGAQRVLVGANIPADLLGAGDVAVDLPALVALGDADAPLLHVLVGQCLALLRCLHLGLKPDSPAEGVLTRVVEEFAIHRGPPA